MHEGGRPHEAVVEWFDSHCHIQDEFAEAGDGRPGPDGHPGETHATRLAGTVARASQAGVTRMVCVGTDAGTSAEAVRLAESLRAEGSVGAAEGVELWATVGLHPHDASHGVDSLDTLIEHLPTSGVVVGIGECGLDYHYDHSPRPAQREAFAQQIELATRLDLALVVHTREAWPDTFDILAATGVPERTIIHCFTAGVSTSGPSCRSAGWSPSRTPVRSVRPPPSAPWTGCWWRPTARSWPRFPIGEPSTNHRGFP